MLPAQEAAAAETEEAEREGQERRNPAIHNHYTYNQQREGFTIRELRDYGNHHRKISHRTSPVL